MAVGFSGSNQGFIEPLKKIELKELGGERCQLDSAGAIQELRNL